jgi:hypothetical protein
MWQLEIDSLEQHALGRSAVSTMAVAVVAVVEECASFEENRRSK